MSVIEVGMTKSELRQKFTKMRQGLSKEYRSKTDIEITSRLLCSEEYSNADLVLTYVSADNEPDTKGLIGAAFANGKKVAVPLCCENNTLEFYLINSLEDLVAGKYGLSEPDKSKCKKVSPTGNSLCVVPALSFDAKGFRLGRGGGYYDRFLKDFKGVRVGLCYNSFLALSLPRESYDEAVDIIVTESFFRVVR